MDSLHRLWILDALRHKVNVYDSGGAFLSQYGSYGKEKGKLYPGKEIPSSTLREPHYKNCHFLENNCQPCFEGRAGEEKPKKLCFINRTVIFLELFGILIASYDLKNG